VPRILLLLLCVILLWAGEPRPTTFVFEETVAGKPSPITDRSAVEAIANQHRERLARARAELPAAIPLVARQLRSDIGAMEAERERLAVVGGGTITVGRRVYVLTATTVTVDADGARIEVDLASRRGTASSGSGSEPALVAMAPPPEPLPLTAGKPGAPIKGRATLVYTVTADGRDYSVSIDPTLPNALAYLIPSEGDDVQITVALARLPGMPLDIAHDSGDFVRRFTCVDVK
jgi:hypothetical protein